MAISKRARVCVKARQSAPEGESSDMELYTDGELEVDADRVSLSYAEGEDSGLKGQITKLVICPQSVDMSREGELNVTMHFEEGQPFATRYVTPFGAIELSVLGSRIISDIGQNGGKLHLEYILDFTGAQSFMHTLDIDVRVVE